LTAAYTISVEKSKSDGQKKGMKNPATYQKRGKSGTRPWKETQMFPLLPNAGAEY